MEKPLLDDRSYRVIQLLNKLEILSIYDTDTDKAAAAMDVNVGSFSDPDDLPRAAHAVDHLCLMGTKKVFDRKTALYQYVCLRMPLIFYSLQWKANPCGSVLFGPHVFTTHQLVYDVSFILLLSSLKYRFCQILRYILSLINILTIRAVLCLLLLATFDQ
jgi:hypothetical protein